MVRHISFSFHPSKIITTFEGGAATTNNLNYFDKLKLFRSHGITKDYKKFKSQNKVKSRWYYEQLNLGYNYWMNDVQAALGLSQLKRLDKIIKKRNILAKRYDSLISNIDVKKQKINSNSLSTFHLYIIRLLKKSNIKNYNKIFKYFENKKIGVNLHYLPIHLHPYYKSFGFKKGQFPNSEHYSASAISLPMYENLNFSSQEKVIKVLTKAIEIYND